MGGVSFTVRKYPRQPDSGLAVAQGLEYLSMFPEKNRGQPLQNPGLMRYASVSVSSTCVPHLRPTRWPFWDARGTAAWGNLRCRGFVEGHLCVFTSKV